MSEFDEHLSDAEWVENANRERAETHREELVRYVQHEYPLVEIVTTGGCCDACAALNGKRMSPAKALKAMPIPHAGCTHEYGCRCWWRHVDDQDEPPVTPEEMTQTIEYARAAFFLAQETKAKRKRRLVWFVVLLGIAVVIAAVLL